MSHGPLVVGDNQLTGQVIGFDEFIRVIDK